MEGVNGFYYSQDGTFTINSSENETPEYIYDASKPKQAVEESCLDIVIKYAKIFFKLLLFPIFLPDLLFRSLLAQMICPYRTVPVASDYYTENKSSIDLALDNKAKLHSFSLFPQGEDGPELSAIKIIPDHQKDTPGKDRKWIVITLPNAIIHEESYIHNDLICIARKTGLCVAVTNYRGCWGRPDNPPKQFSDLVEDVDSLVKDLLLEERAHPKNILIQGLSLGGAVGVEVASRYQDEGQEMHYLGQNTFDALEDTCVNFLLNDPCMDLIDRIRHDWFIPSSSGEKSILRRLYFGAKEITTVVPHMITRVIVFVALFFENLYFGKQENAMESLLEIGKTVVFAPFSLVSGVITLVSAPLFDFTFAIRYFDLALVEKLENTIPFRIINSPFFSTLAKRYIQTTGWTSSSSSAWEKIKGNKIVSQVRKDDIIPFMTSLAAGIKRRNLEGEVLINEGDNFDHCSELLKIDKKRYYQFIEDALSIKFDWISR